MKRRTIVEKIYTQKTSETEIVFDVEQQKAHKTIFDDCNNYLRLLIYLSMHVDFQLQLLIFRLIEFLIFRPN